MPSYKTIDICVSEDYEIPEFYLTADTTAVEEALTLGAFLHEKMCYQRASADVQRVEAQKAKELTQMRDQIAQIRTMAAQRTEELEKEIEAVKANQATKLSQLLETQKAKDAESNKIEREASTRQYDVKIKALNTEISVLSEQNRGLQARREMLEADRLRDIQMAEARGAAMVQKTLDEKERMIQRLEALLGNLNTSYNSLSDDFKEFSETQMKKSMKAKGTEYEDIMAAKLKKFYGANPSFFMEEKSRSSVGHEADIIMNWDEKKVLWEGKWYAQNVPTKEVTKFQRDMKENPHILVGIMMSRYSAITGKSNRSDVSIEFEGHQMFIYVSRADEMGDALYPLLPMLWQVHWESKRTRDSDGEIDNVVRIIEGLIASIAKRKLDWNVHKSHANEMLKWMSDMIMDDDTRLRKAYSILKSGDNEESDLQNLFVDPDGNTQMEDTIAVLKKIIVPANDSSITLNSLADLFVIESPTKMSTDTAKTRIRNVFLPDRMEGGKGVALVVNGVELITSRG